ncbi:hypothetical protein RhiirA4_441844 [Rhizophagus irregularis]|uniref:DUF2421 domain-containing protein n=1 Tax=Rhizophagus irregularis TaxID=588596 RepID=A0A2I1G6I4_9GLOM|nr:hypothetical protein RhiirA4_441844 [Rhizophagus irregularis]
MAIPITESPPQNNSSGIPPESNKPTQNKISVIRKNITIFLTSNFKKVIKGTLAYWLAFLIIFIDVFRNHFKNPQTFFNIVLPTIILNPAATLGEFVQTVAFLIFGILIGHSLFILEAGALGNSEVAMIILLFVTTYLTSIIRAINMKYFGFGLIICVGAFQGIFTRIIFGSFRESFLSDAIVTYFIGITIAWVVNVIIWPTTAERNLISQICISLTNLSSFHTLLLKDYLLSLNEDEISRLKSFSTQIRSDAFSLVRIIDALEAELTYSKFSIKEYKDQVRCINLMQLHLLGLYNSMSKRCKERFDKDSLHLLKENSIALNEVCRKSIISFQQIIDPQYHKNKKIAEIVRENELEKGEIKNDEVEELDGKIWQDNLRSSLKEYEEKQSNIMIELLHLENITLDDVYTENITSTKDDESIITIESENKVELDDNIILKESTWEDIFFSYFFTFGFREYVEELLRLGKIVNIKGEKKLRINYKWMIPDLFKKKIKSDDGTSYDKYSNPIVTIRVKLAKFLYAFKSNISISAIKTGVALIIYILPLLIGGSAKDFFVKWNINTGVVSVLVLMTPVIGQTYVNLSILIAGTIFGSIWAYVSLIVWETNPYGLSFFIILYAILMYYIASIPRLALVSLLSRLSYATVLIPQFVIMKNKIPNANSPIVATYKNLAITAIAIILAFILQIVIYPNLARHELRRSLSNISVNLILYFEEFCTIFNKLLSNTSLTKKQREDELQKIDDDLRHVELKIQRSIIKIQPLFAFSSAEPRLIAPFPILKYDIVLVHLRHILDRLSWARLVTMSRKDFSDNFVHNLVIPLHKARTQLQSVVVVLMYLFANALISKRPLPHILPKSTEMRNNLFNEAYRLVKELTINEQRNRNKNREDNNTFILKDPEYIRFYAVSSIMGGIANHVDAIGDVLKDLFGETVGYT